MITSDKGSRTWAGMMSLSPQAHFECLARVRAALARKGQDFDALDEVEQFKLRTAEAGRFVTTWIRELRRKRVALLDAQGVPKRYKSGAKKGQVRTKYVQLPLRYLCVAEPHPNAKIDRRTGEVTSGENAGCPHFHVLVYEVDPAQPVTERRMVALWKAGRISQFRLVKTRRRATYACKYLTCEMNGRVRASFRFGKTSSDIAGGVRSHPPGGTSPAGADTPPRLARRAKSKDGARRAGGVRGGFPSPSASGASRAERVACLRGAQGPHAPSMGAAAAPLYRLPMLR